MSGERRRYFRIDDYFEVRFQVLGRNERVGGTRIQASVQESLDDLRNQSQLVLGKLRISHHDVSEFLGLMELRMRRLEDVLPQLTAAGGARTPEELVGPGINISACGVAFWSPMEIALGTRLRLVMTLKPDDLRVSTGGRVVGCDVAEAAKDGSNPYMLRVDFHDVHPDAQELLVQHILRRQGSQIRALREAEDR